MAKERRYCLKACGTEIVSRLVLGLVVEVDAVSGFPHELTCPEGLRSDGRAVSATVLWCWNCNASTGHQRVANDRVALVVCLQCGGGRSGAASSLRGRRGVDVGVSVGGA